MAVIGRINTIISATTAPLTSGLGKAANAITGFGGKMTGMAGMAAKATLGLTGVVGAFAAVTEVAQAFEEVDAMAKLARSSGVSMESLVGLKHAADLSGVSYETLTRAQQKLNREGKNIETVADQVAAAGSATERARIAFDAMGRQGAQLLPLLEGGGEAIRTMAAEGNRLAGISMVDAESIEAANDAITSMKLAFTGVATNVAVMMAPVLQTVVEKVMSIGEWLRGAFTEVKPILSEFGDLAGTIFSTVASAAGSLFGSIKGAGGGAFQAFKTVAITTIKVLKSGFLSIVQVAKTVWDTLAAGANALFGSLGITGGVTFDSIKNAVLDFLFTTEFAFQNIGPIAELLWEKIKLGAVTVFENLKHFFTIQIPTVATWMANNWRDIFKTIFDFTSTVFINLGKNIRSAMKAIWDFIKSGGKSGLNIAWTPLTEGFKNAVKELPDIPDRAITELEKKLQTSVGTMGTNLSEGLAQHIKDRRAELLPGIEGSEIPEVKTTAALAFSDESADKMASKLDELQGAGAVQRGSADAFSQIFKAMRGDGAQEMIAKSGEKTAKESAKTNQLLGKLIDKTEPLVAGTV